MQFQEQPHLDILHIIHSRMERSADCFSARKKSEFKSEKKSA
jgi:hypothetical protein